MINKILGWKWTMANSWCPNFETVFIKKSQIMGMLTMHLVVGVGILMPLFLLSFSYYNLDLPHVYMILGLIIFVSSIFTTIILLTKFINHGSAGHGFFAYSDTFSRLDINISLFFIFIKYIFYLISFVSTNSDPEFEIKKSVNLVEGFDCHFIYLLIKLFSSMGIWMKGAGKVNQRMIYPCLNLNKYIFWKGQNLKD